jgi:hypothetical protein
MIFANMEHRCSYGVMSYLSHLSTSFFNNNMDPAHEPADDA